MTRRIVAIHLYNDYSGSPKVLAGNLQALQRQGYEIIVHTSDTDGPLTRLEEVHSQVFSYRPERNKLKQLWKFLLVQILLFSRLIRSLRRSDVVYVNTLLPFGAAIAAQLRGCQVIYHLHETSVRPAALKGFLKWVAKQTANRLVYVSAFLQEAEPIKPAISCVIPNSLPTDFIQLASNFIRPTDAHTRAFTCLMACSLRAYKGVNQMVELARKLPEIQFELVLNSTEAEVSAYFNKEQLPDNLVVFPRQSNMHWFYQRADLVLNLSLPDQWIETFGMTLLEGMHYGLPVIGPAVGGPAEIIEHRQGGFQTSAYDIKSLALQVRTLAKRPELYRSFSQKAKERALRYSHHETVKTWISIVSNSLQWKGEAENTGPTATGATAGMNVPMVVLPST